MIKLIAIVDAQYGLSKDGQILWSFADDLKFFKSKTIGYPVIMGTKTYFSLPNRPLDYRVNCVLSRHIKHINGCEVFSSLELAIDTYPDAWIIGGESVYNYALGNKLVKSAFITIVHKDYSADQFLSKTDLSLFYNTLCYNEEYEIREYIF